MTTKEKQEKQVLNISESILEAAEELLQNARDKKQRESLYMFSSILEGYTAVQPIISQMTENQYSDFDQRLTSLFGDIANELEKNNFTKVTEQLQFILIPLVKKWNKELNEEFKGEINNDEPLLIGVFYDKHNPIDVYPKERIQALCRASEEQNSELIFFDSDGVNLTEKVIEGYVQSDGDWIKETLKYPSVVHNIFPSSIVRQSIIERKLRREIPFTSFGLGNKLELPRKLVKYKKYAELLAPFKVVRNEDTVIDFIAENDKAVLKPISGNQGKAIFFIEKNKSRYIVSEHTSQTIMNEHDLRKWLNEKIKSVRTYFLIQKYIKAQTKVGQPFDIRAHMQKNENGKWDITRIYARIGHKNSILSNISRGGKSENLQEFMKKEYSNQAKEMEQKTKELALDLTWYLDKIHGSGLDELGLDIAIDENNRFWIHEVNNGPQSTYHENDRAKNTIAYAKYIGVNQIFNLNIYNKKSLLKQEFDSNSSNLDIAELIHDITVGMLVHPDEIDNLVTSCAYVSAYEQVNFYYFTPQDIDYEEMVIRGHFYINKEWVPMIVPYPDVIYDRLRLRGFKEHQHTYEELDHIPFTNELKGGSISKLKMYEFLGSVPELNEYMIPYKKINRVRDILNSLDTYRKVILKPEKGTFAVGVHYIEKLENFDYKIIEQENESYHSFTSLKDYLRELIKNGDWIVQKFIESRTKEDQPFDIRVHMMKNQDNEWDFIKIYPRIGYMYANISLTFHGGYIGRVEKFLERNFPSKNIQEIISNIEILSTEVAEALDNMFLTETSELGIDIALDSSLNPYIIEVNVNKIGYVYYEFDIARKVIPYAKSLVHNK